MILWNDSDVDAWLKSLTETVPLRATYHFSVSRSDHYRLKLVKPSSADEFDMLERAGDRQSIWVDYCTRGSLAECLALGQSVGASVRRRLAEHARLLQGNRHYLRVTVLPPLNPNEECMVGFHIVPNPFPKPVLPEAYAKHR